VFSKRAVTVLHEPWPENPIGDRLKDQPALSRIPVQLDTSLDTKSATQVVDRVELQTLMWDEVGLARDIEGLQRARTRLSTWRPSALENRLFTDWEDANLLLLAHAVAESALARHESRGSHYRLDYPHVNPEFARPILIARQV